MKKDMKYIWKKTTGKFFKSLQKWKVLRKNNQLNQKKRAPTAEREAIIIYDAKKKFPRKKRWCYASVVQRIGSTKSFAQHQHSNRRKSDDAIQVLCSTSAQQNYLHNTSTAIEEKAMMLFKCNAAHRHNKIICTT